MQSLTEVILFNIRQEAFNSSEALTPCTRLVAIRSRIAIVRWIVKTVRRNDAMSDETECLNELVTN